ncbi:alanine--tRNA ligase, partial [Vibrio parahaemolyticus V-223/04]
SLTTSVHVHS